MRPTHTETPKMCNFAVPYNTSTSPAFAHEYSSILYYMHIYFRVRQNKKNRRWRKSGKKMRKLCGFHFIYLCLCCLCNVITPGDFWRRQNGVFAWGAKNKKGFRSAGRVFGPLWTINRTVFSTWAILFYKFNINNDNVIIWLRCFRSCTSTGWFEHRKGEYSIYIANEQKLLDLIALNKFQCWMYRVRDAPPAVWAFYKSRAHRTTATSKSTPLCRFYFHALSQAREI